MAQPVKRLPSKPDNLSPKPMERWKIGPTELSNYAPW